jgi:N-acetylmuramoyl-L-alanine amidase
MAKFTITDGVLFQNGVKVTQRPSPNHGGIIVPRFIIMHYTAAKTAESAISWMVSPASKVAAHLHIDRLGNVVQLLKLNVRGQHAGQSQWKDKQGKLIIGLNSHSVGIELQNIGTEQYTPIQLQQNVDVCKALAGYFQIEEILGHSDIAPGRKTDPGKQFPIQQLRDEVL